MSRGEAFDNAVELRMQQRLATRQAHRDLALAEQGQRVVHDGVDEIGIERVHAGDVVPDAVGTTEVAMLRQREAEQHVRTPCPRPLPFLPRRRSGSRTAT